MFKKWMVVSLMTVVVLGAVGVFAIGNDNPKYGGTLRYAMIDEPPTLDQHVVTSDLATTVAQHIFEGLFTFNAQYAPVPQLAESYEVANGGKLVIFHLRKGVLFHNGKEMTSRDVVASLERWGKYGVRGPILFKHVDHFSAPDKYTVEMYLTEPFGPWPALLAFINGGPVIYPAEVVNAAGEKPIEPKDYIGTGPYKFVEWVPGRYILLKRFDKYSSRTEPTSGYSGKRVAYIDEIKFIPVPDVSTRVNGVKSGEYDYAEMMPGDLYEGLKADPSVKVLVNQGAAFGQLYLNEKEGLMANQTLRQAILAALDTKPILRAAFGPEDLWKAQGSIAPEGTVWYTKAGTENYSQNNAEKAKKLAKEAGYNGQLIRFMTTTSYKIMYDQCVVIADQLRKAGFNIDLQVYDWATLVSRRSNPALWDMFFTYHGFVPDPVLYTFMSPTYPGWWDNPKKTDLTAKFTASSDFQKRYEIWEQLQALLYEQVPFVKTGDFFNYNIASSKLGGLGTTSLIWPSFWNVWIK